MHSREWPGFSRRVFLSHTLQALGAAACLPLAARCLAAEGQGAAGAPALKLLSAAEYATLDALGDALIPPGGAFEIGARDVDLARRIDSYLPAMAPGVVVGFRGALAFIESEAPRLAGKAPPFSSLERADRAAVLSAMLDEGGLPRGVFLASKFVCLVHFYTADQTWAATGYDGPMLLEGAS
jgi:Gluconate 2-dehydrogenase subunit 3